MVISRRGKVTIKERFPPLLARVTCLQQVINCMGRKGGIGEIGFSLPPSPPALFLRLPRRLSTGVNAFKNVTPLAI